MSEIKITAIIPVRKNSKRLKNKNFLTFFKGKSLLELKIDQLKKIKSISKIVVSSDSLKAKKIAGKKNVLFHKRINYFASSRCSGSNFFKNLAESIEGEYIVYCPCTSPILSNKTFKHFFNSFFKLRKKYDSFNTVSKLKTFMWKNQKPINYNSMKAPNSQDLPENYYSLTFGINIIERKKMISYKNIVGKKPKFIILDKFESIDINDELDFKIAQAVYKKLKL
jgi:CMP-N-acetylneuraminic acid synthetase|tara:strand:+ start:323 stop:994 length:672 start_codon:yes stop_codon:yes gene_type:complete